MIADPEFTAPVTKFPRRRWGRWARWWVVYPALALMGGHLALTGSPVPLWHIERLREPVAVCEVRDDALVLADGRVVRLPLVRSLPRDHALFRLALRHGVEVDGAGEVFGLIDHRPICGMEGVTSYRVRVNLTGLAAWLRPEGIDHASHPSEEIPLLHAMYPPPPANRDRFSPYDRRPMIEYRRALDHPVARGDHP